MLSGFDAAVLDVYTQLCLQEPAGPETLGHTRDTNTTERRVNYVVADVERKTTNKCF